MTLTKTTVTQNEAVLCYHRVSVLYFFSVIFAATINTYTLYIYVLFTKMYETLNDPSTKV